MGKVNFDIDRMLDDAARRVMRAVDDTTEAGRVHAVRHSHVDTGRWQANWYTEPARRDGLHVRGSLRNDTPYGGWHNWPTSRWRGAFTLEGAVDAEFPSVSRRIAEQFR